MDLSKVLNLAKDKSGTICAAGAVVGVFVTAYFSGKAAVRVEHTVDPDMDRKEKLKEYCKAYWKTAVSAGVTTALIVESDRIHVSKEIALAGMASMWKDKYVSLDKKVVEKIGPDKTAEIHKEIAEDKAKEKERYQGIPGEILLVYEPYTKQYLHCSRERIMYTMLTANQMLQDKCDVRLSYVISMLGGCTDPESDRLGWSFEHRDQAGAWAQKGYGWIELIPDVKTKTDDGREALCLFYTVDPEYQDSDRMLYYECC